MLQAVDLPIRRKWVSFFFLIEKIKLNLIERRKAHP